jgi:hypothetical protein
MSIEVSAKFMNFVVGEAVLTIRVVAIWADANELRAKVKHTTEQIKAIFLMTALLSNHAKMLVMATEIHYLQRLLYHRWEYLDIVKARPKERKLWNLFLFWLRGG